MVFLKEEAGGGYEEALHLIGTVVKDKGAPVRMLGHALLLAFVEVGAVKAGQAMLIPGEVGRHPVYNDAYAGGMESVYHTFEVVRVAVAGGGSIVARHLVAPGAVIGVFGHGHQLHVGKAHVLAVGRQGLAQQAVLGFFVTQVFPGAQVHLIDTHRPAEGIPPAALFHIAAVGPLIAAPVPDY